MKRRHAAELTRRLEEVYHRGFAQVEFWEAYLWWQRERIGKGVYQDLLERWETVAGDDSDLGILEGTGAYALVNLEAFEGLHDKLGRKSDEE